MCYSVLQCSTVCCSMLQCVTVYCSVLQCVAVCCGVLQCVAVVLPGDWIAHNFVFYVDSHMCERN